MYLYYLLCFNTSLYVRSQCLRTIFRQIILAERLSQELFLSV